MALRGLFSYSIWMQKLVSDVPQLGLLIGRQTVR